MEARSCESVDGLIKNEAISRRSCSVALDVVVVVGRGCAAR